MIMVGQEISPMKRLQNRKITCDTLLMKVGAAKKEAGRSHSLADINLPKPGDTVNPDKNPQCRPFNPRLSNIRYLHAPAVSNCERRAGMIDRGGPVPAPYVLIYSDQARSK